jgi:hypothetical protein
MWLLVLLFAASLKVPRRRQILLLDETLAA